MGRNHKSLRLATIFLSVSFSPHDIGTCDDANIAWTIFVFNQVYKRIRQKGDSNPQTPSLPHGTLDHRSMVSFFIALLKCKKSEFHLYCKNREYFSVNIYLTLKLEWMSIFLGKCKVHWTLKKRKLTFDNNDCVNLFDRV